MKKLLKVITVITVVIFIYPLYGIDKNAGTAGAQFLKIGVGARPSSMGEAYAGMTGDALSIYWNPAGIAEVKLIDVAFQYNNSFLDIDENFLTIAVPSKRFSGVWGFGATYLDAGNQIRTTENALGQLVSSNAGTFSANDLALMASYAWNYKKNVMFGITFKYINQNLEDESANGFASDLGFVWKPEKFKRLSFGGAVQNLGPRIKFINQRDELPLNFKLGFVYNLTNKISWLADVNVPRDNDVRLNTGAEWWILSAMALRVGYSQVLADSDNGLTLGVGFRYQSFSLDYAYLPFGDLGESHRISAGYKFGY